jgi:hypothetical protein
MYSYEDRLRAVRLYIKLGKCGLPPLTIDCQWTLLPLVGGKRQRKTRT